MFCVLAFECFVDELGNIYCLFLLVLLNTFQHPFFNSLGPVDQIIELAFIIGLDLIHPPLPVAVLVD